LPAQHRDFVFVAGCENRFAFYNTPNQSKGKAAMAMSGLSLGLDDYNG